jgi:hypothetical protein
MGMVMVVLHKPLQLQEYQFITLAEVAEAELLVNSMDRAEAQEQLLLKAVEAMEQRLAQEQV